MIKEKSVSHGQGVAMQDDQSAESVDGILKGEEGSSQSSSNLTLSGSPSDSTATADQAQPSSTSIPDPALEALNQTDKPASPSSAPAEEIASTAATGTPADDKPGSSGSNTDNSQNDDVLDPIKKEALQKLEPLVNELDLHPEEKYRALMMIIQATDNKDLVNEAFQAADKIEDTKTRAQALLSIVNEIEYFKSKQIASNQ